MAFAGMITICCKAVTIVCEFASATLWQCVIGSFRQGMLPQGVEIVQCKSAIEVDPMMGNNSFDLL